MRDNNASSKHVKARGLYALAALLESHENEGALCRGLELYGERFNTNCEALVKHVYLARHRFFGHAHPKFLKGLLDADTAFQIAKQALVARWTARAVLALELNRPLVTREEAIPNAKPQRQLLRRPYGA